MAAVAAVAEEEEAAEAAMGVAEDAKAVEGTMAGAAEVTPSHSEALTSVTPRITSAMRR